MIFPPIIELAIIGVFDEGVPDRERIVLRPTQAVDLAQFAIVRGVATPKGVVPVPNNFCWLGDRTVYPPAFIIVYTGKGEDLESTIDGTGEPVHVLHWGCESTLFGLPGIVVLPIIIRIGAVTHVPRMLPPSSPPRQGS